MTFLPIFRRELAIAARRTATYRRRLVFAGLAAAMVVFLFLYLPLTQLAGPAIFKMMSWAGLILCVLEGLRATADSISRERRDGTLGLLLLTDLRAYDVLAGKLASACVLSFTTVIAMLPAFALPLLIGGVSAGECWRLMLSLLAALFLAVTVGTLVSALATSPLTAFVGSLLLVLSIMVLPVVFASLPIPAPLNQIAWLSGPMEMFRRISDASFGSHVISFSLAASTTLLLGSLMIGFTGIVLVRWPRLEEKHLPGRWQKWLRPNVGRNESWDGASARTSPAVWLAERTLPGQRVLWILIAAGLLVSFLAGCFGGRMAVPIIVGCIVFFAFLVKLWVAAVAPISLHGARHNGALELLLCTPISPIDLVRGQVDALYGYFLAPALIIAGGFTIFGITGLGLAQNAAVGAEPWPMVFGIFWFMMFFLDFHALAYAGLWFGLTTARVDLAIAKTVFVVLLLPWITLVIPILGVVGILGWPMFWISWASARLNRRFREESAEPTSAFDRGAGWIPWLTPRTTNDGVRN